MSESIPVNGWLEINKKKQKKTKKKKKNDSGEDTDEDRSSSAPLRRKQILPISFQKNQEN